MQIRIITYNIHKGVGGIDRRYRPERIIETLAHYRPDVVLMQEVEEGVPRSRRDRQVDLFGDALGLAHRAFQPNVKLTEGRYGNAILSRFPLTDLHDIELTVPLKKRRRAQAARCQLHVNGHTRTLYLYNFHLGLAGYERRIQLRRFLKHESFTHAQQQTAMVAAGDFNDVWGMLGKRLLEPVGFRPATRRVYTFPAIRPMRPLDRVYSRGNLELLNCYRARLRLAKHASDHLPVIAEFTLTS